MKIRIDIDCTPIEARSFLGLPDLTAIHAVYLERMEAVVREGLSPEEVEKMMRAWMPAMASGFEQWRQAFWPAAGGAKG